MVTGIAGKQTRFLGLRTERLQHEDEMNIQVTIQRGEDGYYVARCPSLKSCWSQGKTREEALANIEEAITLYLEPSPIKNVHDAMQEVVELSL